MKKAAATNDPQKLQPWKKRTSKYGSENMKAGS
jgi:hypothetical protein